MDRGRSRPALQAFLARGLSRARGGNCPKCRPRRYSAARARQVSRQLAIRISGLRLCRYRRTRRRKCERMSFRAFRRPRILQPKNARITVARGRVAARHRTRNHRRPACPAPTSHWRWRRWFVAYTPDWERLADALQRVMAAGASEDEVKKWTFVVRSLMGKFVFESGSPEAETVYFPAVMSACPPSWSQRFRLGTVTPIGAMVYRTKTRPALLLERRPRNTRSDRAIDL